MPPPLSRTKYRYILAMLPLSEFLNTPLLVAKLVLWIIPIDLY